MAAGTGTRFGALCQEVPKALLPCAGDILIGRLVDTLLDAGIEEIRLGLGWKGSHIKRVIGSRYKSSRVVCIDVPDYEIGPLQTLVGAAGDSEGAMLICPVDLVVDPGVVASMLRSVSSLKNEQVTLAYDESAVSGTPLTVNSQGRITSIGKGAARSAMMIVGGSRFLECCKDVLAGGASKISQVLEHMLAAGQDLHAYHVQGYWHDIDTLPDLLGANRYLLKHYTPRHGGFFISKDNVLDSSESMANDLGITIGPGTQLRGPCLISRKCVIASDSTVGPNVYMDQETILEDRCTVVDAILFDRARINQGTELSSVVVRSKRVYSG